VDEEREAGVGEMSDEFFNCIIIAAIFMLLVPHVCAECYEVNTNSTDLLMHIECTNGTTPTSYYGYGINGGVGGTANWSIVTYPQEYYDLNKQADDLWAQQSVFVTYDYNAIKAVMLKLNANQIALEKQNELINEQNELLKKLPNQTYSVYHANPTPYVPNNPIYNIKPNH